MNSFHWRWRLFCSCWWRAHLKKIRYTKGRWNKTEFLWNGTRCRVAVWFVWNAREKSGIFGYLFLWFSDLIQGGCCFKVQHERNVCFMVFKEHFCIAFFFRWTLFFWTIFFEEGSQLNYGNRNSNDNYSGNCLWESYLHCLFFK